MSYDGIDYGSGSTNRNSAGVSFGVIAIAKLASWIWDDFEANYGDLSEIDDDDPCAMDGLEPLFFEYEKNGLKLMIDSNFDCWVFESPVQSTGTYCSPCAPGAVSLGTDGSVPCLAR